MSSMGEKPGAGYEATLHVLSHAPVPGGLEERVNAALEAAPRSTSILAWPLNLSMGWMRAAAAAAIMLVVGGGGWGVYRHAQSHAPARVNVAPAPAVAAPVKSGFSSAGAVRTPQTVTGPAVTTGNKGTVKQGKEKQGLGTRDQGRKTGIRDQGRKSRD